MAEDTDVYVGKWVRPTTRDPKEMVGRKPFHDLDWTSSYIAHLIGLKPEHRVLDLCCGNGIITSRVAKMAAHITGVDYSSTLLEQAREISAGPNIEYLKGDALALDQVVGERRFDRIYCISAFQHFDKNNASGVVLRKLRRLVDSDGLVAILEVPDRDRKRSHLLTVLLRTFLPGRQSPDQRHANAPPLGTRIASLARNGAVTLLAFGQGPDALGWWWKRGEFAACARECGFECRIMDEPPEHPLHTYRFDAILTPR